MPATGNVIIAASPNCFFGFQPFAAYQEFHRLGIRHVEVPAQLGGTGGIVPEAMDDTDTRRFIERLAKFELTAISVGAYCDLLDTRQVAMLQRRIDFAQRLGAPIVVSDATRQIEVSAEQWRRLVNTLRFIGDYASDRGIQIALETHGGITRNGALAAKLLDAVDHPSIGVNYDTGNIYYYNDNLDPAEDVKHVTGRIIQVHLKDTTGGKGEWQFCALGDGRVNFPAVAATLRSTGFNGPYSLELEGVHGEDLNRAGNAQRIRQSLDYLRRIGLAE